MFFNMEGWGGEKDTNSPQQAPQWPRDSDLLNTIFLS